VEEKLLHLKSLKRRDKLNLMKSKILALSKNEEFKSLLKKKKISNKYVTIFFGKLPNKDNKKLNISFSVKKKIGNAVKRNKIKRRLRSIVNDAVKIISINFDFSILVLAKESMLNNEYKNIKETLFQDLEKIK
jgi:ribonuclease P protein component